MMEQTAPAFQLYASDTIADKHYRLMSLAERGLFLSLLCECWVNRSVPDDPSDLAKWLGFQETDIKAALSSRVLSFFSVSNGELISPKLERYRKELEERKRKMVAGGRKGAKTKWGKAAGGDSHPIDHPSRVPMGPRVEASRAEKSKSEPSKETDIPVDHAWVSDYEKASRGY